MPPRFPPSLEDPIAIAAALWNAGMDTRAIASLLHAPEAAVANSLDDIKALAATERRRLAQ